MTETQAQDATTPEALLATFFDPATRPNPYPVLNQLREATPFTAMDGSLLVLGRYRDVDRVLRHPAASADRSNSRILSAQAVKSREQVMTFLDPPDHTRLRRLVSKAFTPRVVADLEPRVREIVDEMLDEIAREGDAFDVPVAFSYPLAVRVICELLGVPPEDHKIFGHWSTVLGRALDPLMAASRSELQDEEDLATRAAFYDYFRDLIAQRGRDGDDLLSRLVRAEEEGDQLSEDELLATCALLVMAGHETTANLISHGVLTLLRHPDQLQLLREDPSRVPAAVDELLRYEPSVQMLHRMAKEPMVFDDLVVPAGDVLLLNAAANRDPRQFPDPDRFDIDRGTVNRLEHLSFSAGPHYCLGSNLGKLEATVALEKFVTRMVDPQLDADSLQYRPHIILRGPEHMTVMFQGLR
ncbi:MAG: cytochrome P450 [Actinomadura rubrobrunea]|nr:cytochrome P450 [Actinomadura rubrobrunea]